MTVGFAVSGLSICGLSKRYLPCTDTTLLYWEYLHQGALCEEPALARCPLFLRHTHPISRFSTPIPDQDSASHSFSVLFRSPHNITMCVCAVVDDVASHVIQYVVTHVTQGS